MNVSRTEPTPGDRVAEKCVVLFLKWAVIEDVVLFVFE